LNICLLMTDVLIQVPKNNSRNNFVNLTATSPTKGVRLYLPLYKKKKNGRQKRNKCERAPKFFYRAGGRLCTSGGLVLPEFRPASSHGGGGNKSYDREG
jgi:hypothetical protein